MATKTKAKTKAKTAAPALKPCKRQLSQTEFIDMCVAAANEGSKNDVVTRKHVRNILAKMGDHMVACLMEKGLGKWKPAVLGIQIMSKHVAARKMPAIKKGTKVKGFGGVEVISPGRAAYTKPASVRFRARALKAAKDRIVG